MSATVRSVGLLDVTEHSVVVVPGKVVNKDDSRESRETNILPWENTTAAAVLSVPDPVGAVRPGHGHPSNTDGVVVTGHLHVRSLVAMVLVGQSVLQARMSACRIQESGSENQLTSIS